MQEVVELVTPSGHRIVIWDDGSQLGLPTGTKIRLAKAVEAQREVRKAAESANAKFYERGRAV